MIWGVSTEKTGGFLRIFKRKQSDWLNYLIFLKVLLKINGVVKSRHIRVSGYPGSQ